MENNIKKYDLKFKKVFINLIIAGLFLVFAYYMLFVASSEEKFNMFMIEYTTSIQYNSLTFGSAYICGLCAIPVLIYMLELLIYKINSSFFFRCFIWILFIIVYIKSFSFVFF